MGDTCVKWIPRFNNILTLIIGYSQLVMEQLPISSKERQMVLEIRIAGMRAKELVKQISSPSAGRPSSSANLYRSI